jgi:hypothetical protein
MSAVAASCWLHIGKELRSVGLKTGTSNVFTDHRFFMRYAPKYGWNSLWGTIGVLALSAAMVFLRMRFLFAVWRAEGGYLTTSSARNIRTTEKFPLAGNEHDSATKLPGYFSTLPSPYYRA